MVEYRLEGARVSLFGPSEQEHLLVWSIPHGPRRRYRISGSAEPDAEVEIRIPEEGRGLWLVNPQSARVLATLDLGTGDFTDEAGAGFGADGQPSDQPPERPAWARVKAGRVLARGRLVHGPRGWRYE
jgi:hypothetical protein